MKRAASFVRMIGVSKLALLGAALTTSGVLAELLLVFGELFVFESHPYIGIVSYVLLPGMIVLGLVMIPIGMALRLRAARAGFSFAALDRVAEKRGVHVGHAGQVILTLSLVNLVIFGVIGYRGFHYTESVEFCGQVCHEVMHPEYTAYARSPHSQISCVECHIGPGAGWFVKSKLSGARQLVAVVADTYSRPIETPVHNLRPAREVCEICHRPEIFHGNLIKVLEQYEPDEDNTRTYTVLNMRVGGGDDADRVAHGIHWHVSNEHEVRYYATDRKREDIVWIEQTSADGTRRVWTDPDRPVPPPDPADLRVMDCVDCHNRPTHVYLTPDEALDAALAHGRIDADIPWIRKLAFELLTIPYASAESAAAGLAELPAVYRERYPNHWTTHEASVRDAVPPLQDIHRSNVFPAMNVQWNTYSSLIGHATEHTRACFRCHDGRLRDETGAPITLDCRSCHYILANREVAPTILDRLETD
ncbi:MAG: cytochrome C [Phycisphaerales bacterium]|nr:NapC/NirT family cytochrome c [Phycisphaerae bacterium]NNF42605.1 cytochrome C [Phycisphaerales bacterium]NNM26178.1 cytochrome C [Phycisphaerales bacterium]